MYALIVFVVSAFLWYKQKFSQALGLVLLVVTSLLGFLLFAPVFPYQFQLLVLRDVQELGGPVIAALIGLSIMVVLTFLFGRIACGYLCPVGAVQELVYKVPVPKVRVTAKTITRGVRAALFVFIVLAALIFSVGVLKIFGIRQFFDLSPSPWAYAFAGVLIVSLFVYRPFCRLVCPMGFLFDPAALYGRFKLHRTDACIECKKCETVCPTDEAKREDTKGECYLCRRCIETCPEGAIFYRKE
jgi:polyferredoxin